MKDELPKIVDKPTAHVHLDHTFKDVMPDVDEFFKAETEHGVITTINSFTGRVNDLAEKYNLVIDANIFKGHSLELLTEFLIKSNGADNRIGIWNYCPIEGEDDFGADGVGVGANGNPATVQVKFRRGDWVLTANDDHLTNFVARSQNMNGVRMEDTKNMLIITTGLKVDERTMDNMLYNKVRVLNREALREMLDNRPEWWLNFWEAVKGSRVGKAQSLPKIDLRQHQTEAVDTGMNCEKNGKIILPTGTGKTLIEADIIRNTIGHIMSEGKVPVIKINASRILLCFQLFEEIFNYLNSYGITARYINFNSGKADERFYTTELRKLGGIYREILSTTSPKEVKSFYAKCLQEKLPMVVFSTYHSSVKFSLSEVVPDLTIHDEAHNLVSNEFYHSARLETGKNLFFTATEKVNEAGLGMNNEEYFGKIIYTKSPREMIEAAEMVPPHVHVVKAKKGIVVNLNKLDKDYEALFKSIADAFFAHQRKLNEESADPSKLGAKILVVCRGQQDLEEMFETKVFEMFRKQYPSIHLFALSSDFGLYNDGEYDEPPVTYSKKFKFLKKIRTLGPAEKAIIFHVDMIGEGIDVPGITGVMPFRNSELVKFVQNIGRASRLHPEDRKKIYAGEIGVEDRDAWIKPRSWVIIPEFLENSEGFSDRLREIIHCLRNDYGYVPRQDTFIDNVRGLEEDKPIDKDNEKDKNRPHADSGLDEFEHEFETATEKVIFEDEVQQAYDKACGELCSLKDGK